MACNEFIQPLDLECLFVNVFAGGFELFLGLAFLAIAILAGKFKMMNITVAVMYGLFIILISVSEAFKGWLMLLLLLLGFGIAFTASKLIKQ